MRSPARQRGLAMLVLLALFAVAAAYMLVSSLNKSSVALSLARADKNRDVMQQAKAALIAWSASETLQGGAASFRPGRLPCPDRNNDGFAESSCGSSNRLGRLPYKTLGIDDLRDASGERLWYAMSGNFRSSVSVINSDTQGQLSISGLAPATKVVAVVLAPGMRLGTQNRSPDEVTCTANNDSTQPCNTAINYLEDINGDTNTSDYVTAAENLTNPSILPYPFNDQLLTITQQDLFSVVEPVVAARIQRDIVAQYIYNSDPTLTDSTKQWSDDITQRNKSRYFDAWGAFPFASPFDDPSNSNFDGQTGTYEGLLPVVDSNTLLGSANYEWTPGWGSVVRTGGPGSISSFNCGATTTTSLTCTITSSGVASQPRFRMSGTVPGVGFGFAQLSRLSDVTSIPTSTPISARSLSGRLNSAGDGIVMLDATMPWSVIGTTVTVTISNANLIDSPLINPFDGIAGWFTTNRWHWLTYYAVSPGYAPGGAGSCNPSASPMCLSVANLPPNANPTTNTRAIVILAGRSLNGSSRPSSAITDYLEAQNAITAQNIVTGNYTFETGLGKVSGNGVAINDRVIVIAP